MAFDLDDEELEATRKMHGLDKIAENDTFIDKIEKENNTDKEIQDLIDFAELLRPEQRYYTNLIKEIVTENQKWKQKYLDEVDKRVDIILLYNKLLKESRENKKKYLSLLLGQFPDNTETYKKYKKELDELLQQEETNE